MAPVSNVNFTTRPELQGTFGVAASTHWTASAVAMGILERGGNAFDAAVAAGFTLQIVEPHLNGPGGEAPIMVCPAGCERPTVICGQGVAPKAATIQRFTELGLELVPGTGLLAACVPGAFDAWMLLLRDYGTISLGEALEPALHYASNGIPVLPRISDTISSVANLFNSHWAGSAAIYLPDGKVPAAGSLLRNEAVARTYARILTESENASADRERQIEAARDCWYRGFVAAEIDQFFQSGKVLDTEGEPHRGLLTGDDLAAWSASTESPVSGNFRGFEVFKFGPWSQGPVMLQQLAILQGYPLEELDPAGPDFLHLVIESSKLAFADREAFYGDPDFTEVPIEHLLSEDYANQRRELITDIASHELQPGMMADDRAWQRHLWAVNERRDLSAVGAGEPTVGDIVAERGDTVHLDIIDRHGNMVSATPSGGWLQSSPVIPKLGFPLGTRAQMFWLEPGLPASLEPGKRPRTTLSTSMAFRDGKPYMAWGTPGGDQQDQWSTQLFLRHAVGGKNLQEALETPNWHSDHFPASFWPRAARPGVVVVEGRTPSETIEGLRARGHVVEVGPPWSEGRLSAVSMVGGHFKAASDPRSMQGYAVGR
ncbi:MAG: gamma-glutamyltransferase family protein [Rhizobiaceae bacterium]|nr:gamma-glutamyltransferase family protein [Rhizobiaceae bacterium]